MNLYINTNNQSEYTYVRLAPSQPMTTADPANPLEQEVARLRQLRDEAEQRMQDARNELTLTRLQDLIGKCFAYPEHYNGPVVYKVVGVGRDAYNGEDLLPVVIAAQRAKPGARRDCRSFDIIIRPFDVMSYGEVPEEWNEITEAQFQQEFRTTMMEASQLAFIPPDYDATVPPLPSDDDEAF